MMRRASPGRCACAAFALLLVLAAGALASACSSARRDRQPSAARPQPTQPAVSADRDAVSAMATPAPGTADAGDGERAVVAEVSATEPSEVTRVADGAIADLAVLISIDGLRPDVLFPNAPNIHRMREEGSAAASARTISKSSTLPSHASMVSGVDFPRHGLDFNAYRPERGHILFPTIFSVAQRAGLSTALFVGKRKLQHLLEPQAASHFEVGGVYCSRVNKLALPYLQSAEPGVVFLHFSDPDGAGHLHGWMSDEYLAAVRRADRCVGHVLDALGRRGKLGRTLVVLTADHGGHDHDHATPILPDTHIPWIAWGGAARRGARVTRRVFNTDTAASILFALGLPMPADIEGKPVFEALAEPAPSTRLPAAGGR